MHQADVGNPWIESVLNGRPRLPAWAAAILAALLGAGVVWGGRVAGSALAGKIMDALPSAPAPWPGTLAGAVFRLVVYGPLIVIAVAACAIDRRPAWLSERRALPAIGVGAILGLAGFGAALLLTLLAGDLASAPPDLTGGLAIVGALIGLPVFALCVAAEELYFRGWLQPLLCARWGVWTGVIATALLFAGLHVAGGARAPMSLLNLFLGGLVFGLLALRSGGLWAPFAAHLAWNWTEACGVGLETNPGLGPNASFTRLLLQGDPLWSGGDDRMNASLAATLVLLSLLVGLAAFGVGQSRVSPSATLAARRSGSAP